MTPQPWFDPTQCLIGGNWGPATSGDTLPLINPSDGSEICAIARGTASDINAAVTAAQSALNGDWGRMTALERGRILTRLGQLVLERVEDLAALEAALIEPPSGCCAEYRNPGFASYGVVFAVDRSHLSR